MLNFKEIKEEAVGGKATSLAELVKLGFRVPEGFVILPQERKTYSKELPIFLAGLGKGPWAIRSSAMAEDGAEHSFAGQFETFLNCKSLQEVTTAIEACFDSFQSQRVQSYAQDLAKDADLRLCVIVQNMVDAKAAGVLFSANPVDNRRDIMLINCVEGLGDKLVDGKVEAEQLILYKNTTKYPDSQLLNKQQLKELKVGTERLISHFKQEIDAEWAIDQKGKLYWLQARPITTLTTAHFNELDTPLLRQDEILTRGNVGEMMPGAITPLTFSVFGRAIEIGLQDFYICCGALKAFTDDWRYIKMHYNHLFISISGLYDLVGAVQMVKKENIEFNIIGHTLQDTHDIKHKPFFSKVFNQIKLIRYLNSGPRRLEALAAINASMKIEQKENLTAQYQALSKQLEQLNLAYAHHYCTSSQSGSYYTTMTSIISGAPIPKPESHEIAASLLVDIDGIAGKEALDALLKIAVEIAKNEPKAQAWCLVENKTLLTQMANDEQISPLFTAFLANFGHRCIREAELSEKDWSQDPLQIMPILKKQIEQVLAGKHLRLDKPKIDVDAILKDFSGVKKAAVKYFLPKVRKAIAARERSKSLCIKIQQKIKLGYCFLADLLVREHLLEDQEQIFFLTHQEIGKLIESKSNKGSAKALLSLAKERQAQFPAANCLDFPDVSHGYPTPLDTHNQNTSNDLQGTIVSQGTVTGPVKVIRSLAEADQLEQGDIMVCRYTDIGWTPYFALIGGLITEIGSPLSHGAVVAREYGIPAVVNVKGAMTQLANVKKVTIDSGGIFCN